MLNIKRVYDKANKTDGFRILIDRLWPRGLSKQKAKVDLWLKDVAPSTELRKWFNHDPEKWLKFKKAYFKELKANSEQVKLLRAKIKQGPVTLVYGAKDQEHNDAVALKEYLKK